MSDLTKAAFNAFMIVVDIDGTLADPTHRLSLLPDATNHTCLAHLSAGEIARFMSPDLVAQDAPIVAAMRFVASWSKCRNMRFLTSRWETLRDVTAAWLAQHGWEDAVGDMRAMFETDKPAVDFKRRFVSHYPRGTIVIDDDPLIVEMCDDAGLQAFLAPGCF